MKSSIGYRVGAALFGLGVLYLLGQMLGQARTTRPPGQKPTAEPVTITVHGRVQPLGNPPEGTLVFHFYEPPLDVTRQARDLQLDQEGRFTCVLEVICAQAPARLGMTVTRPGYQMAEVPPTALADATVNLPAVTLERRRAQAEKADWQAPPVPARQRPRIHRPAGIPGGWPAR